MSYPADCSRVILFLSSLSLAVMPVLPACSLMAEARLLRSSLSTVAVIPMAVVFVPCRFRLTLPSADRVPKVAVVLAVAVTPVSPDLLLIASAILAALSFSATLTVLDPSLPTTVRVCAPTLLPSAVSVSAAEATSMPCAAVALLVVSEWLPRSVDRAEPMPKEMVSPALAPTWNWAEIIEPSSSFLPLNVVVSAIRVSSCLSWSTSDCREARSEALLVSLADCTANSRMRCRMLVDSCIAPSAVWASEMPSLALRVAWLRPRIWEVIRSEMARPAASSLAELIRRPLERRCMDFARFVWEALRFR